MVYFSTYYDTYSLDRTHSLYLVDLLRPLRHNYTKDYTHRRFITQYVESNCYRAARAPKIFCDVWTADSHHHNDKMMDAHH